MPPGSAGSYENLPQSSTESTARQLPRASWLFLQEDVSFLGELDKSWGLEPRPGFES